MPFITKTLISVLHSQQAYVYPVRHKAFELHYIISSIHALHYILFKEDD